MLDEKMIIDKLHGMPAADVVAIIQAALSKAGIEDDQSSRGITFEGISQAEHMMHADYMFAVSIGSLWEGNVQSQYHSVASDYTNDHSLDLDVSNCQINLGANNHVALAA